MSFVTPVVAVRSSRTRQPFARPRAQSAPRRVWLLSRDGRRRAFRIVLFALSAAAAMAALALSARAAGATVLIIPPDDGYGFDECLTSKSACGAMAAGAWCAANGLKGATSFGRAEDLTPSSGERAPADARPGSFYVSCGDGV